MSLLSRLAVAAAKGYGALTRVGSPTSLSADYLVVAGGGGGGEYYGGGGGAGGLLTSTFTLSTLNTYSITVGAGGNGSSSSSLRGSQGSSSSVSGTGLTTVTSTGGGGGGSAPDGSGETTGGNGGSGGGGAANATGGTVTTAGGTGTSGQGNNGGSGITDSTSYRAGGGGGGSSAVGANGTSSATGSGGNGTASSISGTSVTYAGGGGGGAFATTRGSGGTGGGGAGGVASSTAPVAGTANTGGGGGGGSDGTTFNGAAGGSGIVIISYTSATPKFVGGTITTSGGKQIHTFTSSGTLSPITPITAEYLVVAGGGGSARQLGGYAGGGGGGAGGLLSGSTTIYSGATYVVTVGAGGAGGTTSGVAPSGSNSVLSGTGLTTLTSTGGGGGGGSTGTGANGGSGGGGSGELPRTAGTGTSGQGNNGGAGVNAGGGGGGAGAAGSVAVTITGGAGGIGTQSSISGTATYYAGGGGGGAYSSGTAGTGGSGGGGNGGAGTSNTGNTPGTANTGGGAGGTAGDPATAVNGQSGGSGIVIISYAGSQVFNGGLVTSSGGNTIHTFTSTGALTPLTNNLNNSLRFRSSASAYLSRTPTLAGSTTIGTFSNWLKLGAISTDRMMYHVIGTSGNNNRFYISFNADNTFQIVGYNSSASIVLNLNTTQVLRDPSAWYHIVVAIDTTQATSSNRAKLYINGNQVTAFSTATYPSQNQALGFTNNTSTFIGANQGPSNYFDGYMTDINFIDGQALEPYYFGNNDANGVWKPILYKGTYGTNGFYLTFGNTTSTTTLGYDSSPNGNNWTCNNISLTAGTTYDAMTDVPTNTSATVANYAVMNPLWKSSVIILAGANLNVTSSGSGGAAISTIDMSSGKYYCEVTINTGSDATIIGIVNSVFNPTTAGLTNANTVSYYGNNGDKFVNGSQSSYGASYTTGDIIGIALDVTAGTVTFYKNNTSQGAITHGLTGPFYFATGDASSGSNIDQSWNFGQRPFSYTPPTGFVALNTFNLPTPTILQGNKYMDATLYTGNGAGQTIVNQGQFYPDLIWVKSRSNATNNNLFTSVLSGSNILKSNSTDGVVGVTNAVTAFNSNGFTLGSDSGSIGVNINSNTYVAWQWLAGATTGTTTNTNGSITSYINVNTTAGFSQVYWTGTAANGTLGHGLGVAPKMIITKCRGASTDWAVYHASIGNTGALRLNLTAATETDSRYWNNTSPTSTVWSVGSSNASNAATAMVAYCWAEIAGFSKFGSYTGNGSTDGTFVATNFKPKFVMIKVTSTTNVWLLIDATRNSYNVANLNLNANDSSAENTASTGAWLDFTSNGFKIRNGSDSAINSNGATYVYACFASHPFKNSNAV